MKAYMLTFEKLAEAFGLGEVRAIQIDYTRGIMWVMADDPIAKHRHPGSSYEQVVIE